MGVKLTLLDYVVIYDEKEFNVFIGEARYTPEGGLTSSNFTRYRQNRRFLISFTGDICQRSQCKLSDGNHPGLIKAVYT